MKEFVKAEIEVMTFAIDDVVTASTCHGDCETIICGCDKVCVRITESGNPNS